MVHVLDEVGRFSDVELVGRLEQLVKADQARCAKLIVHLGEVQARELHRERGFSSMFEYCCSGLGMSEGEAYLRLLAARVGRRFPLVLERLSAGAVHLSAIKLLAPHLTAENHVQLLDRVRGKSKQKIKVLLADLAPKPDVSARLRKLPERRRVESGASAAPCSAALMSTEPNGVATTVALGGAALGSSALMSATSATPSAALQTEPNAVAATVALGGAALGSSALMPATSAITMPPSASLTSEPTAPLPAARGAARAPSAAFVLQSPRARASSTPLGLGRFELKVQLGQEAQDALDQLVELFRHQNPSGDLTRIVERALCELLKSTMKRRFAQTNAPRARAACEPVPAKADIEVEVEAEVEVTTESTDAEDKSKLRTPGNSRYIPRAVLREVHARDMGQCTFVSSDGRRCTERGFLEVHHHNTTFARGGEATAGNLRLMCRAHNMLLAEQDYGRGYMHSKLREAGVQKQLSLVPGQC